MTVPIKDSLNVISWQVSQIRLKIRLTS